MDQKDMDMDSSECFSLSSSQGGDESSEEEEGEVDSEVEFPRRPR